MLERLQLQRIVREVARPMIMDLNDVAAIFGGPLRRWAWSEVAALERSRSTSQDLDEGLALDLSTEPPSCECNEGLAAAEEDGGQGCGVGGDLAAAQFTHQLFDLDVGSAVQVSALLLAPSHRRDATTD